MIGMIWRTFTKDHIIYRLNLFAIEFNDQISNFNRSQQLKLLISKTYKKKN